MTSYGQIQFKTPVKALMKPPPQVKLVPIEGTNFFRFSDGTDRKFVSVSKVKDTLSIFDKMGASERMAEKEINAKGIYAPDALTFGYDPQEDSWYIGGGQENYEAHYNEYICALEKEQKAILADWEQRGNVGKERGNFIDIAFDLLCNKKIIPHDHCESHSVHQEIPFDTNYLISVCDDFMRLKKCLLDLFGTKLITQYLAHFNMPNAGWNYGLSTLGDLMILNPSKREFFFFDVKADKHEKMYPNAQAERYEKPMEGEMRFFKSNLKNKYFFQVICSVLCVEQEKGVWNGDEWIDLSDYTYAGGGIIHWDNKKMRFNVIHLPSPRSDEFLFIKAQSKNFIRDYFVNFKKEQNAKSAARTASV